MWDELYARAKAVLRPRKVSDMLTAGESAIRRVIALNYDGKAMSPCGCCRELMAQLMPGRLQEVQVMLDYEARRVATLGALAPEWWAQ